MANPKKTHAERSEETRQKIINAVVFCITEHGVKKTTTSAIAKQAGVTWGALQHHFGDLNGCFNAAFNDSFQRFSDTLGTPPPSSESLETRTAIFVQRAWQHYNSPHFLSVLQLLLNNTHHHIDNNKTNETSAQQKIVQAMDDIWKTFFIDAIPSSKQRHMLARYTHSVLTGLAISYSHQWQDEGMQQELTLLQQSLLENIKTNG